VCAGIEIDNQLYNKEMKKKERIAELEKVNSMLVDENDSFILLTNDLKTKNKELLERNKSVNPNEKGHVFSLDSSIMDENLNLKSKISELTYRNLNQEETIKNLREEKTKHIENYISITNENRKLKSELKDYVTYNIRVSEENYRLNAEIGRLRQILHNYDRFDFDMVPLKTEGLLQSDKDKEIEDLKNALSLVKMKLKKLLSEKFFFGSTFNTDEKI